MPTRHVRSRAKGSRLPQGVVCVTRPGKWGNPFYEAATFRWWLTAALSGKVDPNESDQASRMVWIAEHIAELRGKDLACWCKCGKPCHADVLIDLANRGVTT